MGQEEAISLAKIAAVQRRNLLLVGPPGTGKSMIAHAIALNLPKPTQEIRVAQNPENPERPFLTSSMRRPSGRRRRPGRSPWGAHRARGRPQERRPEARLLLPGLRIVLFPERDQLPQLRQDQDRAYREQHVRRHLRHAGVRHAGDDRREGAGEHHPSAGRRLRGDRRVREGGRRPDPHPRPEGAREEEEPPEQVQDQGPGQARQGPVRPRHRRIRDRAPRRCPPRSLRRERQDRRARLPEGDPRGHT
ncbi:ATP-binding protein [Candidatus Methanomethylophilus sp. 1R26]|uniref:ATP-binding protein n=1 Tax=Candidatus Methanomethylophilus sp. 1R26 TaxID=1769296 RepID=UPI001F46E44B|nr:ATP-binding protein [Candidatus Methanomethylophilus sp. 1R26]